MSIETAPGRRFESFCWVLMLSLAATQVSYAVEPGSSAPDMVLPVLNDVPLDHDQPRRASSALYELVRLSDLRGKVVYLDFWDTSCAPCRESLPLLSAMIKRLNHADLKLISINLDPDPNQALRFLAKYPVSFPVASDPSTVTASAFGVTSLPTGIFIDRNGTIVHVHQGFRSKDIVSIEEKLTALVAAR
jgi:cytochrome c biogenesis protein CcmG/thiol:disulfide interchange protein DsbE